MSWRNATTLTAATSLLLREINESKRSQMRIAELYAGAMLGPEAVDWPGVNQAIINRWSKSGLVRIKEWAHKIVEAQS